MEHFGLEPLVVRSMTEKLQYNQCLEASRKAGSNGKVFEEEVDTGGGFIPCTPLSFSGFPSLDAAPLLLLLL